MAHVLKDMQPLRVLLLASAACACAADQSGRTISDEVDEVSLDGSPTQQNANGSALSTSFRVLLSLGMALNSAALLRCAAAHWFVV